MDIKTKNFIFRNILDVIKVIVNLLQENKIDENKYKVHMDYVKKVLDIVLKDHFPNEYNLILSKFKLIENQDSSYDNKMYEVGEILIEFCEKYFVNNS